MISSIFMYSENEFYSSQNFKPRVIRNPTLTGTLLLLCIFLPHQTINCWSWIITSTHLKKAMSLPCFLRTGFVGAWVEGLRVWWVAEAAAAAPAGWVRAGGSVSVWGWMVCGTCTWVNATVMDRASSHHFLRDSYYIMLRLLTSQNNAMKQTNTNKR